MRRSGSAIFNPPASSDLARFADLAATWGRWLRAVAAAGDSVWQARRIAAASSRVRRRKSTNN